MLPSEYVTDTLMRRSYWEREEEWQVWEDRLVTSQPETIHRRAVLQEVLVQELLLTSDVIERLVASQTGQRWTGDAMLISMHDRRHTVAGLLMIEEPLFGGRPLTRQIIVPPELKLAVIRRTVTRVEPNIFSRWFSRRNWFDEMLFLPVPLAVVRKPRLEFTINVGDRAQGSRGKVTIGLPVRDRLRGAVGFITVDHGLSETDPEPSYVLRDGSKCKVLRRSPNWDAAFVSYREQIGFALNCRSIMKEYAPGRGMPVRFMTELGAKTATVDSVDPILPRYSSKATGIARVYTNRCTELGDSGAVLVSDYGEIIGHASERTVEGEDLEFSVWLWMAGVLDALKVEPVLARPAA